MKLLIATLLLFTANPGHTKYAKVNGKKHYLDSNSTRTFLLTHIKNLYTDHFKKIKEFETENDLYCIPIKFTYIKGLAIRNAYEMKSLCRSSEIGFNLVALYTTYKQIENNYFTLSPEIEEYQFSKFTEKVDF